MRYMRSDGPDAMGLIILSWCYIHGSIPLLLLAGKDIVGSVLATLEAFPIVILD